jgi:predicted O-methyltransferase YrrM
MGHSQSKEDNNLGSGWLYYAFGRILRPRRAVVIGSLRGFAPIVIAKALADNSEPGEVTFIDPSLVDDFWKDPERVDAYFRGFGLTNIRHHCMTTQEFVTSDAYREIDEVGFLFIDGRHTEEQASFDYNAFSHLLEPRGLVILHDSMNTRFDKVYGSENAYRMSVKNYVDRLKTDPGLELIDLPFGHTGLTVMRKRDWEASHDSYDWLDAGPF